MRSSHNTSGRERRHFRRLHAVAGARVSWPSGTFAVRDISGSGALLEGSAGLHLGDVLDFDLKFMGLAPMHLHSTVVRHPNVEGWGIVFDQTSRTLSDALSFFELLDTTMPRGILLVAAHGTTSDRVERSLGGRRWHVGHTCTALDTVQYLIAAPETDVVLVDSELAGRRHSTSWGALQTVFPKVSVATLPLQHENLEGEIWRFLSLSCTSCGRITDISFTGDVPFCQECIEHTRQRDLSELYDDLGVGD